MGRGGLTLELLLEDGIVLYPNLPLLLVDSAADDVLHLLEREERLARLRVDPLPQCTVDIGGRRHACGVEAMRVSRVYRGRCAPGQGRRRGGDGERAE